MVQSIDPYFVKQVYFDVDTTMTKMCVIVHESQNRDLYVRIVSASDNVTSVHLMDSTFFGKSRFPIHSITWCLSHHPVIEYLKLTSIPPHELAKLLRSLSNITSSLISFECSYWGTTTLEGKLFNVHTSLTVYIPISVNMYSCFTQYYAFMYVHNLYCVPILKSNML